MALDTIKDFDFGVGADFRSTPRVSVTPSDVSKTEVDFIVWLVLEQEFRKSKKLCDIATQQKRRKSKSSHHRTQCDGFDNGYDEDDGEVDDADEGDEPDRPMVFLNDPVNEKIQIARQYAEECLQRRGNRMLWQDLSNDERQAMLILLCKNTELELFEGTTSIQSVPEIFSRLRSSKFRSKYNVKRHLAKGGFGEVFLVTREGEGIDSQLYAVKRITPSESILEVKAAITESKILKKLKGHQNIVEICDYWLEIEPGSENGWSHRNDDDEYEEGPLKFYIQLEYCSISLEEWKENNYRSGIVLEKSQILNMALQIFDGLAHIHRNKILHLDINSKNILWKDLTCTKLKIVDFGLAISGLSHGTKTGTPGYIAPELPLTQKSDVFSAAVTTIGVAKTIYTINELMKTIERKAVDTGISVLDELLFHALDENPSNRPSAATIVEKLSVQE